MLDELIDQAKRDGKWLWCHYQDLWFSPDKLRTLNSEGKFRWGPQNFKLRDPRERVSEAEDRVLRAIDELNKIKEEINPE